MRGCSSFYLHTCPTLVKMVGIQSHMFLSEPVSEEKCKPPVKKPTIPWWWWWVGRVRVRVNHLFFVRALQKTCSKIQILSTSLRKNVNHLLKNLAYPDGGGVGGGGRGWG